MSESPHRAPPGRGALLVAGGEDSILDGELNGSVGKIDITDKKHLLCISCQLSVISGGWNGMTDKFT